MKASRWIAAYLASVVTAGVLGSVLQTQHNLWRLARHGVEVGLPDRAAVTLQDLTGFAPLFLALVAGGFLVAFGFTGGVLRRYVRSRRGALYTLAGTVAVATILLAMRYTLGLDAIAAASQPAGFAMLLAAGAAGGALFARVTR